jgi:hypothetical protein
VRSARLQAWARGADTGLVGRRYNLWWLCLPFVILGLYMMHSRVSWGLAGLVALVAGAVVALNYRGVADRVPPSLGMTAFNWSLTPAATRKGFVGVAIWGVVMIVIALERPDLVR